jgi:hypothetical protein
MGHALSFLAPKSKATIGAAAPTPPPVPPVPPSAITPTLADSAVQQAGASQRGRAALAAGAGFDSTLANPGGAQGDLVPPPTAKASLLGKTS